MPVALDVVPGDGNDRGAKLVGIEIDVEIGDHRRRVDVDVADRGDPPRRRPFPGQAATRIAQRV